MKVFLTGGTGFVGSAVLEQLIQAGYGVRCLVRIRKGPFGSGSEHKLPLPREKRSRVEITTGDVTHRESLQNLIAGCDAVVHLVGIIRETRRAGVTFERVHYEGTRNVVDAAQSAGTQRFLHVSALGTRPDATSSYHQTKYRAEEYIKASGLSYAIFRPSIIFGEKDKFVNLLRRFIFPFSPVFIPGNGKVRLQPIAVEDLALGITRALSLKNSENKIYEVGGPEQFTFNQLIDAIAEAKGVRHYFKTHIPLALIKPAVRALERFTFFPLTSDQLMMLSEDNVCDPEPFFSDFDLKPIRFRDGIKQYLR